jgi:16S rRNA G966 N2-methylase RsmD
MSNIATVPQDVHVQRSDPVYMAHAYLTKVPVAAIEPFIEAFTKPGDIVADPFAGSGMTGVAAAALGRRARLFDISVLGRHIGSNYVNLVDPIRFQAHAEEIVGAATKRLGNPYQVQCNACGGSAKLAKRIWSVVVACPTCAAPVNYYRAFEAADWNKSKMQCRTCGAAVGSKARRVGEEPVIDSIDCTCSSVQLEQPPPTELQDVPTQGLRWPDVEIGADRQMYQASALGKHGLTSIASFYSPRNLAVLAAVREEIDGVNEPLTKAKLLFAFTAILTRASKRYQWSRQRPLNAANANYYIAPVFYEWNVFDLFTRKVEAAVRSDDWIRERRGSWSGSLFELDQPDVRYELASADALPLPDSSVDYIFTDPPFGSNLFYADMALFQEAWLDGFTDTSKEAVIDRGHRKKRTADRYEQLLVGALTECRRILRPGGMITMVFGNSSGSVWALVQRAVKQAGLVIEPDTVVVLNKGQRSVKGLASGFEHVATADLILSMMPGVPGETEILQRPSDDEVAAETRRLLGDARADSPSHLYLELLKQGIRSGWDLSGIHLRTVTEAVRDSGWQVQAGSGKLTTQRQAVD